MYSDQSKEVELRYRGCHEIKVKPWFQTGVVKQKEAAAGQTPTPRSPRPRGS